MNEVQALVDLLAEELGRPIGVDDARFRAVAYSSHPENVDTVRRESIMGRAAPAAVTAFLESLGLTRAEGLVRVPANAELDMVSRACFPLRFHDRLLGYLWLIEGDEPLDDDALALAALRAQELAAELARLRAQESVEREQESVAVDSVTAGRGGAAVPGLAPAPIYTAVVLEVVQRPGAARGTGAELALAELVARARRAMAPRHVLAAVHGGHDAVLLLACYERAEREQRAAAIAADAQREAALLEWGEIVVAVGGERSAQEELRGSFDEAMVAARVARSVRELPAPVLWEAIGPLALVARLLEGGEPADFVPASLQRLLDDPDGHDLVGALEAFLDHGGDVAAAAEATFMHRSTLYKRLHRVEQIAGVDLRRGADRLELHLGLQLVRLAGRRQL